MFTQLSSGLKIRVDLTALAARHDYLSVESRDWLGHVTLVTVSIFLSSFLIVFSCHLLFRLPSLLSSTNHQHFAWHFNIFSRQNRHRQIVKIANIV